MAANTINTNAMDFIICTNDRLWFSECEIYIRSLHVPHGMTIGIIPVWDAESMCNGYNTGMKQSSARYKVYLHQDLFIINRDFISHILHIFESDTRIGIIGLIGSLEQNLQTITYASWNYGSVLVNNGFSETLYECGDVEGVCQPVDFVDGMIIATQYDLPWREDVFTEWDFYDKSICMEFRKQGYLTVVPRQEKPWCIHDCGPSSLFHWKENALRFIHTYPEYFSMETTKIGVTKNMSESALQHLRTTDAAAQNAFQTGDYEACLQIVRNEVLQNHDITKDMVTSLHLSLIHQQIAEKSIFFQEDATPETIRTSYIKAHLLLRRQYYGLTLTDEEHKFICRLCPDERAYITDVDLIYSAANTVHSDTSCYTDTAHVNRRIRKLIRQGKLNEASDLCISAIRNEVIDKDLYIFFILFLIWMKEQTDGLPDIFHLSDDPDVLINHYRILKFLIRRQEFPQMEPLQGELYSYCRKTNTSVVALEIIAEYSTLEPEQVIEKIRKE